MRWLIFALILLAGAALGMGLYLVPPAVAEAQLSPCRFQPAPRPPVDPRIAPDIRLRRQTQRIS